MTPLRQWLRPPGTLLLALVLVTLVAVLALGWFGRNLLDQERMVDAQRARERQEQVADRIAANAQEALAETGERIGYWVLNSPADGKPIDGVAIVVHAGSIVATPQRLLLYRPMSPDAVDSEAPDNVFADGEALEFQQSQPAQAVEWYKRLSDSKNAAVRAGALTRMARVLRKMGKVEEARSAYRKLAGIADARVAGAPADLVARLALTELSNDPEDAETLQRDLLAARWSLSRGQFEFYWSEASRHSGLPTAIPVKSSALSQVVAQAWGDLARDESPRGQKTIWLAETPYLLIWRGTPDRRAILATKPESIFRQIASREDVSCALADADGRLVLGRRAGISQASVRTPAETRLPWTLYVTTPRLTEEGLVARQRFLVLVTALTVSFLIAGAYFIARAIRTEAAVARLQSDFVSAVSHEFRSPLTSMRQLSEILALGRVPNDERRQTYYDTLVRETIRLQRLVESLLNLGRMEAGVRRFSFEELDAAKLVENIAAEFEPQIRGTGRNIEISRTEQACGVDADPEALMVALRNLVDNALKYAPECPTVWVECGVEKDHVAISVRDQGPGIPRSERRAIFRKFVRGSAAAAANVKGSGVGLAMVRHIVALHQGRIRITSAAGIGSTFTILLPRRANRA